VRHLRTLLISVFLLVAIPDRAAACTIAFALTPVGPSFSVKLEHWGRLVKGLEVTIKKNEGHFQMVADTDENGVARFANVPPGHYSVMTRHNAGTLETDAAIDVKPGGPADVTISRKWPYNLVSVRSLKGTIRGPDYFPGQSQPRLALDLLEGLSGRRLRAFETTDKGEFSLEDAPAGLYFLNLNPSGLKGWSGQQITGQIAVAVNRDAQADHLDLDLGWSSCGLYYANSSTCPQRDVRIGQFSGRVVDSSGAIIARARILLLDPFGVLVEQLQSDNEGKFAASRALAGAYELVVSRLGFSPYRRTVHVEATAEPSRRSFFTVQLGVLGNCSSAEVQ
jgi:hypothetical protein